MATDKPFEHRKLPGQPSRQPASVRSSSQILKGTNHILHSLYAQSQELVSLEHIVRQHGGANVSVSSFKNNELTLIIGSSAAATRLRYRQRNLISALRSAGLDVDSLKFKVAPAYELPKPAPVERQISGKNAEQLADTADYIDYQPLSDALRRLAKRGTKEGS